jgi:hypothetical protein
MRTPRRIGRAGLVILSLLLLACTPPGKGPRAERGYRFTAPVIHALERHLQARGAYPDSLPQLIPTFLPDSALREPQEGYPFQYRRTPDGYALTFRYTGPGMNHYTWTPRSRSWECGGHF